MANQTDTSGGTRSALTGNVRRYLSAQSILRFTSGEGGQVVQQFTKRLRISGLSALASAQIIVAIIPDDGQPQITYPANPGTVQAFPWIKPPEGYYILGKPTTQAPVKLPHIFTFAPGWPPGGDPTAASQTFGCPAFDGVDIVLTIDPTQYSILGIRAALVISGVMDYTGAWWDARTVENVLGGFKSDQVNCVTTSTG